MVRAHLLPVPLLTTHLTHRLALAAPGRNIMPSCQAQGTGCKACSPVSGCKSCAPGYYSTKLAAGWKACKPCLEGCKACAGASTCASCKPGYKAVLKKGLRTCAHTPPPPPKQQKSVLKPLPEADLCCAEKLTVACFVACRCCVDGDGYVPWRNCRSCEVTPAVESPSPVKEESPAPRPDGYNPCCDPLSNVMCFAACHTCAKGDGFVARVNCTAPAEEELPCCPPVVRMDQPKCRDCGFRGL